MPKQDLYTAITVALMFLIGIVLAIAKFPRKESKFPAKYINGFRSSRSNHQHNKAA
jgi:hypothetical protein